MADDLDPPVPRHQGYTAGWHSNAPVDGDDGSFEVRDGERIGVEWNKEKRSVAAAAAAMGEE